MMDCDAFNDGYNAGFRNGWHDMSCWIMLWMDEERYEADKRHDVNMVRFIDRFTSCLDEYTEEYWNV